MFNTMKNIKYTKKIKNNTYYIIQRISIQKAQSKIIKLKIDAKNESRRFNKFIKIRIKLSNKT